MRSAVPDHVLQLARDVATLVRAVVDPGARVVLFGSWAQGRASPRSDIDIAVEIPGVARVDSRAWFRLREAIDELPTLREIDVVDLNHAGPEFGAEIRRECIEL